MTPLDEVQALYQAAGRTAIVIRCKDPKRAAEALAETTQSVEMIQSQATARTQYPGRSLRRSR